MARQVRSQISLHEIDNYTFGTKEAKPEKDSLVKRMSRMAEKYKEEGMRRTVECVLLLHNRQHPQFNAEPSMQRDIIKRKTGKDACYYPL